MVSLTETAALIALLRSTDRSRPGLAELLQTHGSALPLLDQEVGLFAGEHLAAAERELDQWHARGIHVVTVLDPTYPANLRTVRDRPPLIFVEGQLGPEDQRAVAVVGTRHPTAAGIRTARAIAEHLIDSGCTVVSGLAEGVDTAAHSAALERGGRTVAIIGTGLAHCYPPKNAALQREIGRRYAVISQFLPDTRPSRQTFPLRNAVIAGMSLASVIVEASDRSGSRMLGRIAGEQGRPVLFVNSPTDIRDALQALEALAS